MYIADDRTGDLQNTLGTAKKRRSCIRQNDNAYDLAQPHGGNC